MQKLIILAHSVGADGDVTRHRFVRSTGAQVDTEGAKALGVSQYDADDGDVLAVDVIGTTIVETGGAISLEDDLVSDDQGRAIVDPEVGGEVTLAEPLQEADGAGEFIEVLLLRG
ncbi:MAG: capsid cement protein [Polyangiales bacterium]